MTRLMEKDWYGILSDDSQWMSDDDHDLFEYVERWEAWQPRTSANSPRKTVGGATTLVKATLPQFQDEVKDAFLSRADYSVSASAEQVRFRRSNQELKEMVSSKVFTHKPSVQFRELCKFYQSVQRKGYIPTSYSDLPYKDFRVYEFYFPVNNLEGLLAVFGFTGELALSFKESYELQKLEFRGIPYYDEVRRCREMRDEIVLSIRSQRALEIADQVTNVTQILADEIRVAIVHQKYMEELRVERERKEEQQRLIAEQQQREAEEARRREELRRQQELEAQRRREQQRQQELEAQRRAAWQRQQEEARRAEELRQQRELEEAKRRAYEKAEMARREAEVSKKQALERAERSRRHAEALKAKAAENQATRFSASKSFTQRALSALGRFLKTLGEYLEGEVDE